MALARQKTITYISNFCSPRICPAASSIHVHTCATFTKCKFEEQQRSQKNSKLSSQKLYSLLHVPLTKESRYIASTNKKHDTYSSLACLDSHKSMRSFSTSATSPDAENLVSLDNLDKPCERLLRINSKFCRICGGAMSITKPAGEKELRHVCSSCSFVDYFNPKMVVGCVVEHEGKILLCRRAIEPSYGLWTLPAGYMELNESTAEGAVRETMEEATAPVQSVTPYAHWDIPAIGQAYILFRAKLAPPFGHAPGPESLETKLFDPAEIPFDQLAFNSVSLTLKLYLEDLKSGRFRLHYGVIRKVSATAGDTARSDGRPVHHRDAAGRLPGGLAEELFGRYEIRERQSFYVSAEEE